MLLREFKNNFLIFSADVRIKHPHYSQLIPIQISARNAQEAKKIIQAQYGATAVITGLRKVK